MAVTDLFAGILKQAVPCNVWKDGDVICLQVGNTTISLSRPVWVDLVATLQLAEKQRKCLEEGDVAGLIVVQNEIQAQNEVREKEAEVFLEEGEEGEEGESE